jgi:hypothetical protein
MRVGGANAKPRTRKQQKLPLHEDGEEDGSTASEDAKECTDQPNQTPQWKLLKTFVHSASNLAKAKEFAVCNADFEFGVRNSREKKYTENKTKSTVKTQEYYCWADKCSCKRKLVETTLQGRRTTKKIEVFETGEHKQVGEAVNHLPVKRPSFRWQQNSTEAMEKYVKDDQISTPSVVLQELRLANIDYGATLKQGYYCSFC